jgi:hypothetical protein
LNASSFWEFTSRYQSMHSEEKWEEKAEKMAKHWILMMVSSIFGMYIKLLKCWWSDVCFFCRRWGAACREGQGIVLKGNNCTRCPRRTLGLTIAIDGVTWGLKVKFYKWSPCQKLCSLLIAKPALWSALIWISCARRTLGPLICETACDQIRSRSTMVKWLTFTNDAKRSNLLSSCLKEKLRQFY